MTGWEKARDQGFEAQFVQSEALAFKVAAHRNKLLAQWAAARMGLRHADTREYVDALVTRDVGHLRGTGIVETVAKDLESVRPPVSIAEVWAAFEQAAEQAKRDLGAG